ncbi:MAG: dienelactone hydrolase family protein [Ignavibacteria bacterium]|jgi:carboxymethylenebutenolidase
MKNLTFILIIGFIAVNYLYSQAKNTCCTFSSEETFVALAGDMDFKDAHSVPLPFKLALEKGTMISFMTKDGNSANAYEVKSDKPSNKYILMFHEWWGLNDYIKKEAETLQSSLGDVNVLALDLYDGKVAQTSDEASKYVQSIKQDRVFNIINGAVDYAGTDAVFGTIGWCFGGGWSLQASILLGDRSKACVMYYGMPEKNLDVLSKLTAPVLGIFGSKDKFITPELVSEFENNMKKLNKSFDVKIYDAVHAFANPSNPDHDAKATEDAYYLTVNFFKQNF